MFENLKDMMGDAYKADMTAEDVNNFFAGKKFTDLSTGLYVDKNKYERDIQSLQATITEKQNALNAKLTDDEKAWIINIACQKHVNFGYSSEVWTRALIKNKYFKF